MSVRLLQYGFATVSLFINLVFFIRISFQSFSCYIYTSYHTKFTMLELVAMHVLLKEII